jgi:cytochrome c553
MRGLCTALLCSALLLSRSSAEYADGSRDRPAGEPAITMVSVQFAHIKLWFAGKFGNWTLATYELDQIQSGLTRAAGLYSGNASAASADGPVQSVRSAIDARDATSFASAYMDLTNDCNGCHRAMNKSFVTIQVPVNSPFSDQLFVDQLTEGRALAHGVCAECHIVAPDSKEMPTYRIPTPSFADIARRSSFSEQALRQFLSSGHRSLGPDKSMPNPRLNEYQIEEIVAFFAALRAGQ